MSPVQIHAKRTIEYLEQDLVSYEAVLNDGKLRGKLGVGMIANATAALDLFGWREHCRGLFHTPIAV